MLLGGVWWGWNRQKRFISLWNQLNMQYKATFTLSCTAILFGLFEMSYPCRIRIITVSYLLHHVIIFQKLFISLYHICIYTRTHTRVCVSSFYYYSITFENFDVASLYIKVPHYSWQTRKERERDHYSLPHCFLLLCGKFWWLQMG